MIMMRIMIIIKQWNLIQGGESN